jgi:hypothetical protein
MSKRQKETFKTETKGDDGEVKVIEYAVILPKPKDGREAQKVYNTAFANALGSGALLRKRVEAYMREQGLWDDKKESQKTDMISQLNDKELVLQRGGIKLSEAREIALDMRRLRFKLRELIAERNELDTATAEGQAENARFNALVTQCLVYNESGKPVYKDIDDYLTNSESEQAFEGAQILASMLFNLDKNHDASLPENKFLQRWNFVDDELRLVNKDGELVDTDGKRINEDGRYIDDEGNFIDVDGNRLDEDGNYIVDTNPFLDDDGNQLEDPQAKSKPKPKVKAKKKTSPKKD